MNQLQFKWVKQTQFYLSFCMNVNTWTTSNWLCMCTGTYTHTHTRSFVWQHINSIESLLFFCCFVHYENRKKENHFIQASIVFAKRSIRTALFLGKLTKLRDDWIAVYSNQMYTVQTHKWYDASFLCIQFGLKFVWKHKQCMIKTKLSTCHAIRFVSFHFRLDSIRFDVISLRMHTCIEVEVLW